MQNNCIHDSAFSLVNNSVIKKTQYQKSASGPNKKEVRAKKRKERPPITATVFSDILAASILPPMTASPVQKACPTKYIYIIYQSHGNCTKLKGKETYR